MAFFFCFCVHLHHPMVLLVVKPDPEEEDWGWSWCRGRLGSLGLAGSTKITQPSKNFAFIPSLAFSASCTVAYVTNPKPFDLPVSLSVITLAAHKNMWLSCLMLYMLLDQEGERESSVTINELAKRSKCILKLFICCESGETYSNAQRYKEFHSYNGITFSSYL